MSSSLAELPAYRNAWRPDWQSVCHFGGGLPEVPAELVAKRLRDPVWRHAPTRPWRTALRYALGWWGLSLLREVVRNHAAGPQLAPRALAEALAGLFAALPLAATRTAHANLRLAFPESSAAWRRQTVRTCLGEVVQTVLASVALERLDPAALRQRMRVEGESQLAQVVAAGRGAIVLTAHYGPFTFGFARLAAAPWPVAVMVRRQKDVVFEAHWKRLRDRFGVLSIPHQPAMLSVRLALKHLRSGGVLYLAGDQKAPGEEPSVPFFGREVHTHGLPARLSLHTGAAILPAFAEFDPQAPLSRPMTLRIERPLATSLAAAAPPRGWRRGECTTSPATAVHVLLAEYHARLEAAIRRRPASWWWLHNRFHRWPGHELEEASG